MISIRIEGGARGVGLIRVSGHAGYAESGEDIVCSAVSALALTAAIAAEKRGGGADVREDPAFVEARALAGQGAAEREETQVILAAIADGLRSIQQQYPELIAIQEV